MISRDGDTYCTTKDKSLLIAVDGSENAKRAVLYVAEFLRGLPGYCITLLNIISEPPPDYFTGKEDRQAWEEEQGVIFYRQGRSAGLGGRTGGNGRKNGCGISRYSYTVGVCRRSHQCSRRFAGPSVGSGVHTESY